MKNQWGRSCKVTGLTSAPNVHHHNLGIKVVNFKVQYDIQLVMTCKWLEVGDCWIRIR